MAAPIDVSRSVAIAASVGKFRRIVTGHDAQGQAVFLEDKICPNVHAIMGLANFAVTDFWKTSETPAELAKVTGDPAAGPASVPPPARGSVFRVVEFPPDADWSDRAAAGPMMHRTDSIDYAYVIEGEIFAVLDRAETLMHAGDVLIQRGTNHAWANRSERPCKMLFVLIDAVPGKDSG